MVNRGGNFFTGLRPIYLVNKIFGLVPFTLTTSNEIVVHWWDVAYAGAVVAAVFVHAILKVTTATVYNQDGFGLSYIFSEHLTIQFIFLIILSSSFTVGISIKNLSILFEKIIFSELLIYNAAKLHKISMRNRLIAIFSTVVGTSLEIIFLVFLFIAKPNNPNIAIENFLYIVTWASQAITSFIFMQLLLWLWLFIQRLNEIKIQLMASFKERNIIQIGIKCKRIGLTNR